MDLDAICGWNPIVEQAYSQRDTMLYALGLGYGEDPLDSRELPFVYEHELKAVPAMCMVLAQNKFWLSDPIYGVDAVRLLLAEQAFEMNRPLADPGKVRARIRVTGAADKGPERGALIHPMKELVEEALEAPIASNH